MKLDHNLHKSQHFCLYKKGLGVYTLLVCIILNITAFLPLKVIIITAGKICDLGKQKSKMKKRQKKKKLVPIQQHMLKK